MSEKTKLQNQLITLVDSKKKEIWEMRAPCLTAGQELYFRRALNNIMDIPQLVELSRTESGALSIFRALTYALQMGLQVGGQIPQAYIVPKKIKGELKAVLMPTMGGYKFIALSDPPVLKDFYINAVYEKEVVEGFHIDMPTGTVTGHHAYLRGDRGKMIGVYAILTSVAGNKTAKWKPIEDILKIRNEKSDSYKAFKDGKMSKENCAWETDFDMMAIKTAGKSFLKTYAGDKEGLAMALAVEDETTPSVVPADIDDRVNGCLDAVIENTENITEISAETPPESSIEDSGDIFGQSQAEDKF